MPNSSRLHSFWLSLRRIFWGTPWRRHATLLFAGLLLGLVCHHLPRQLQPLCELVDKLLPGGE
jgi:hypothetical protein